MGNAALYIGCGFNYIMEFPNGVVVSGSRLTSGVLFLMKEKLGGINSIKFTISGG